MQERTTTYRMPGLDGVRALAVTLVLAYHLEVGLSPQAGFLGVDIFFVLSGFLITTLLLREYAKTGAIGVLAFYWRRIRRLVPALAVMILITFAAACLIAPDALPALRADLPAALLYASNWWQILSHQSYFEVWGRPGLLQHLWSLGLEEQFYLIWPALMGLMLAISRPRARGVLVGCVALTGMVTTWMAWLSIHAGYPIAHEPTRVYVGTDTHSMGLCIGAVLAVACLRAGAVESLKRGRLSRLLGVCSLVIVLAAAIGVPENSPGLYQGGFALFSLATAVLIWSVRFQDEPVGWLAESSLVRAIGERSYGLYLWHWPLFQLIRPGFEIKADPWIVALLRIATTLVAAELSYRLIELPLRARRTGRPHIHFAGLLPLAGLTLGVMAALLLLWNTPPRDAPIQLVASASPATSAGVLDPLAQTTALPAESAVPPTTSTPSETPVPDADSAPAAPVAVEPLSPPLVLQSVPLPSMPSPVPIAGSEKTDTPTEVPDTLAFGDSVLLGAASWLQQSVMGLQLDAEVGRQAEEQLNHIHRRHLDQTLPARVILHLGTNGFVAESQLRAMLEELAACEQVILVNAHAPRRWVAINNALMLRIASQYPNVVLLDWDALAQDHPEYFGTDGVHMNKQGQRVFVAALQKTGVFTSASQALKPAPRAPESAEVVVPPAPPAQPEAPPTSQTIGCVQPAKQPRRYVRWNASRCAPLFTLQAVVYHRPDPPRAHRSREAQDSENLFPLVALEHPITPDQYWDRMAQCETGGRWHRIARYGGGLGIFIGAWRDYGGRQFAASPAQATREQQIVVANRIATLGFKSDSGRQIAPAGFRAWGCRRVVGTPTVIRHDPASVLMQHFTLGQSSDLVAELQLILALPVSRRYDLLTWQAHRARIAKEIAEGRIIAPSSLDHDTAATESYRL